MAQKLRVACKLTWGLTREAMRTIYLGAIEPGITYAAAVWGNKLRVRDINKLRSIQRIMAIGAASAYRTVSTDALLIIGNLIPIEEKIAETSKRWRARNTGIVFNEGEDIEVESRGDAVTTHPALPRGISYSEVDDRFNAENQIYTDGSKMDNGIGAAIAVYRRGIGVDAEKYRLGDRCTVFQSEMIAIRGAVRYANAHEEGEWHVISDSKSALNALRSMHKPTELMCEISRLIRESESRGRRINFHWTRAHVGNVGNERADELAKEATRTEGYCEYDKAPFSFAKRSIRRQALAKWNDGWTASNKGRRTFRFISTVQERGDIRIPISAAMTQVMTGHGNFGEYLRKIGKNGVEDCACGNGIDNAEHILFDCPLNDEGRQRADIIMVMAGLRWPRNTEELWEIRKTKEFWSTLKSFCASVAKINE